ncbi:NADH dehydrogenase [ubiquinone] iron-sulfur protein 5-like [Dromiciops gliroides]|uniref:NADH dehydrogenase [ubiquinone] iron-sulfur protein 5-like n=1 Tax=Dromiciops gliroides TaxID=33562 RepID=UPI001CC5F7BC|nr:NADH dehydrogenase [ubiquinone] iron-sulfur protein 5-like [Dromiciops gliroides]
MMLPAERTGGTDLCLLLLAARFLHAPQVPPPRGNDLTTAGRITEQGSKKLGINVDKWMTIISAEHPCKMLARCRAFEKEFIECAHGISMTQAKKECKLEYYDFIECLHRRKMVEPLVMVMKQKEKLMKEGKYTPPPHHWGKEESRP